jgi:two-component system, NtrC family, response regulator AtoC
MALPEAGGKQILILEPSYINRGALRGIVTRSGNIPISFEKESICLDNLALIDPGLVVLGGLPSEKLIRFIIAAKLIKPGISILIGIPDRSVEDFLEVNDLPGVFFPAGDLSPEQVSAILQKSLKDEDGKENARNPPLFIGQSRQILKIKKLIRPLGESSAPILIMGEPGVGKELLARIIHAYSKQKEKGFYEVGCQALLGGEMGLSEGTLFFKEIGVLSSDIQAKLLFLCEEEERSFSDSVKRNPVRIIAATSFSMDLLSRNKVLRKDLLFRLNAFQIEIPPLHRRKDDIGLLSDYFGDKFCVELGKSHFELSGRTKNVFFDYGWPLNVLELERCIKKIVSTGDEEAVTRELRTSGHSKNLEVLNIYSLARLGELKSRLKNRALSDISLKEICRSHSSQAEKQIIALALKATHCNRKSAAELLDISYKTFLNKLKAYGLP